MAEQRHDFYVGEKFSTYEEFEEKLTNYKNKTFVKFWKRDCRNIATQQKRSKKVLSPALRYYDERKRGGVGSGGIFLHSGFHQSSLHFTTAT